MTIRAKVNGSTLRWWPAALILALDLAALVFLWVAKDLSGQDRVLNSIALQILALLLLILWILFFSRVPWKIRFTSFGGILLVLLVLAMLVRVREVTGNLVPHLEWRWHEETDLHAPPPLENAAARSPRDDAPGLAAAPPAFPQFLGPNRNAKIAGVQLDPNWSTNPPRQVWRIPIGAGWGGFAVAGNFAITQEQYGPQEMVICRHLFSGKIIWSHSDEQRYATLVGGEGPRATPTISGDKVFTMGGTGLLTCLELQTGRLIWQKNVISENGTKSNSWGVSSSPLVVDSLVITSAGGGSGPSVVAYSAESGVKVWSSGTDPSGYSSPMLANLAGVKQILIFNDISLTAHHPKDGRILWRYPWPPETEVVAQPVVISKNRVLLTSGYGVGSKLLEISRSAGDSLTPKLIWESNRLKAKFTNVVHRNGYVYGLDDGILTCIETTQGKRMWKSGRYGHGQLLLVEDLLIVQAESGQVALVEAQPDSHLELGILEALAGKTWNSPTLVPPLLLVRNAEEAACYELPLQPEMSE